MSKALCVVYGCVCLNVHVCMCAHVPHLDSNILLHFLLLINHNTHTMMQKGFLLLPQSLMEEQSTQTWISSTVQEDILLLP